MTSSMVIFASCVAFKPARSPLPQQSKAYSRNSIGALIIVSGEKWYDNKSHLGGLGTIDLTSHLRICSFREAALWLDASFHSGASLFPRKFESTPLSYEEARERYASRDDSRGEDARSYLVDRGCLNGPMID